MHAASAPRIRLVGSGAQPHCKQKRRIMVVWEWQAWRCFDHIEETFEEKGWKTGAFGRGRHDNEVMPLLAESNGHCIAFFERDPGTNECWFELRDKAGHRVLYMRGANNIPAPAEATE